MIEEIRRLGPRYSEIPPALPGKKPQLEEIFKGLQISQHTRADKAYIESQAD